MKGDKPYNLNEAIKKFHKTMPLQIDLATTVANMVFVKRNVVITLLDKWLYAFVAFLVGGGLIYGFILTIPSSLLSMIVIIISIAYYFGLSVKEYKLMSKKIHSLR
jgi:hypothetical protein